MAERAARLLMGVMTAIPTVRPIRASDAGHVLPAWANQATGERVDSLGSTDQRGAPQMRFQSCCPVSVQNRVDGDTSTSVSVMSTLSR